MGVKLWFVSHREVPTGMARGLCGDLCHRSWLQIAEQAAMDGGHICVPFTRDCKGHGRTIPTRGTGGEAILGNYRDA